MTKTIWTRLIPRDKSNHELGRLLFGRLKIVIFELAAKNLKEYNNKSFFPLGIHLRQLERKRVSSLIDCKVSKTIQSLFNNSKAQNSKLIMKLEIETSLETCGGENPRES